MSRSNSNGTKQSETYTYNLQGRMASVDVDSDANGHIDSREQYEYDDSGTRVAKTEKEDSDDDGTFDTTTRTDYHVDKRNPTGYAQVLEEMNGDTGEVLKSYTFGLDCIEEAVAAGVYRHLTDGHGSTRMLVDALGNVIQNGSTPQIYAYDAHGLPLGFDLAAALTHPPLLGRADRPTHRPPIPPRPLLQPRHRHLQPPRSLRRQLQRSPVAAQVSVYAWRSGEWD